MFRNKPGRERLLGQGTSLQADVRAEGSMASSGNRVTFCEVGKTGLLCETVLSLSLPRIVPNIVTHDITGQNMFPFVFFHKSFEDVYCATSALKTDFSETVPFGPVDYPRKKVCWPSEKSPGAEGALEFVLE